MRSRTSHNVPTKKKPKPKSSSKKRSLNALSIASHQIQDKIKYKYRVEAEKGGLSSNKRHRDDCSGDNEIKNHLDTKRRKKWPAAGKAGEADSDGGSDSDGNKWKLGQVDSDDDSDLDSEQAFGESDEERFDGFTFSGRSNKKNKHDKSRKPDENNTNFSDGGESSMGEDAVDLATMLDLSDSDEETIKTSSPKNKNKSKPKNYTSESEEHISSSSDEDASDSDEEEDKDDDQEAYDPKKITALQDLISNLSKSDENHNNRSSAFNRNNGASEYNEPSDFGLTSKTKITLEDLGLPSVHDPHVKKSLKVLKSNDGKTTQKLEVPLAKRQQDRLDRDAAYEKSKKVLDRWTDTVKHNRRADHLTFPLPDNGIASAKSNKELAPTNIYKPCNDLEATIQNILEESGLATADGKDDEDHIREFEELESKKMTFEEVKIRRDQLRMARELLFREEAKSKRIKKIKSKSYRRVHRKQLEKIALSEQQALAQQGMVPSDNELDVRDRKRAEERMGAKHRNNKWAKAMKETGRAIWDQDTKSGITEMAQKDEELRKRIEGKIIRNEFEDSESSDNNQDDASEDDELSYKQNMLQKLERIGEQNFAGQSYPGARLAKMDFMLRADAARKKENDKMIEEMRRELAGEKSSSEDEEEGDDIGRRIFGSNSTPNSKPQEDANANGLEDDSRSNDEKNYGLGSDSELKDLKSPMKISKKSHKLPSMESIVDPNVEGDAWSRVKTKSMETRNKEVRKRQNKHDSIEVEELDLSNAALISKTSQLHRSTSRSNIPSADSGDENDLENPFLISSDHELVKRAFAGADVVDEFETEKKQTIRDEDEKTIDNTLPGWGSWVGDGVSNRELKRNKGRFITTSKGIKAQNRKDYKLKNVIINEKKVKKNGKYLASNLPHQFENRQQYERSLRIPIGPEWTTKHTFQDATMPRILLKQGIIVPIANPLL